MFLIAVLVAGGGDDGLKLGLERSLPLVVGEALLLPDLGIRAVGGTS